MHDSVMHSSVSSSRGFSGQIGPLKVVRMGPGDGFLGFFIYLPRLVFEIKIIEVAPRGFNYSDVMHLSCMGAGGRSGR